MFVLLAVRPIGERFRRALEMNREAVAADARVERLIAEVQVEPEPAAVIRNRRIEIVDQELRCDPGELRDTRDVLHRHTRRSSTNYVILNPFDSRLTDCHVDAD